MCRKLNLRKQSLHQAFSAAIGLAAASLPLTNAHCAWLNAYGTTEEESYSTGLMPLAQGGYLIGGTTGGPTVAKNSWYARLDATGKVLWSKSIGDLSISFDDSGSALLTRIETTSGQAFVVQGKGNVDLNSGALTVTSTETEPQYQLQGNDGKVYAYGKDGLVAGFWKNAAGDPNTSDSVIAKLDANKRVVWSHIYDFADTKSDLGQQLINLKQGWLFSASSIGFDPVTFKLAYTLVLAKLDSGGNILPGTLKRWIREDSAVFSPSVLADDSILLQGFSGLNANELLLIKLDSNLNFVWGKRYSAPSPNDSLRVSYSQEIVGGELSISGALESKDGSNKLTEVHPLRLHISNASGAIVSQTELQIRKFDPRLFSSQLGSSSQVVSDKTPLYGTTSQTEQAADEDAFYALLNKNLQPDWAKVILGGAHDRADYFYQPPGTALFLLEGQTESWGAGKTDILLGRLNANGAVKDCSAIQDIAVNQRQPGVVASDFNASLESLGYADKGPATIIVTQEDRPLNLVVTDYGITATAICSDGDDSGIGGGTGNNGNSLGQSESADPVTVGQPFSYTVSFTNPETVDATNVKLTDTLPKKTKLVSAIASQGKCKGKGPVICGFGTVTPGATVSAQITLSRKKPGTVTNKALISYKAVIKPGSKKKKIHRLSSTESTTVSP